MSQTLDERYPKATATQSGWVEINDRLRIFVLCQEDFDALKPTEETYAELKYAKRHDLPPYGRRNMAPFEVTPENIKTQLMLDAYEDQSRVLLSKKRNISPENVTLDDLTTYYTERNAEPADQFKKDVTTIIHRIIGIQPA